MVIWVQFVQTEIMIVYTQRTVPTKTENYGSKPLNG